MDARSLRFGLLVGAIGGTAMAAFAMVAMAAMGNGFWTPVNLIAHTVWHHAPLDGTFDLSAALLGVAVHLAVSVVVGTVIATAVERGTLDGGLIFLVALGVGIGAWIVQAFAWSTIDSSAHSAFTPWVLATAHVVFALGSAIVLSRLERDRPVETAEVATTLPTAPQGAFSRR